MYLFIFSPRTSFIYYFDLMDSNRNYLSAREYVTMFSKRQTILIFLKSF